jgi:hypothetical protein
MDEWKKGGEEEWTRPPDDRFSAARFIDWGTCSDGIDNDCDGLTDSADPQCAVCAYVNACDNTDSCGNLGGGSVGCNTGTDPDYNCRDVQASQPDQSVGSEDLYDCNDGIDNDCDGKCDVDGCSDPNMGSDLPRDPDCKVQLCIDSVDVGRFCEGNSGDLPGDDNTDGYYCDTSASPNRCCPVGDVWDPTEGSNGGCVDEGNPGCYDDPCATKAFNTGWYTDANCVRPANSDACCAQGFQNGEQHYEFLNVNSY